MRFYGRMFSRVSTLTLNLKPINQQMTLNDVRRTNAGKHITSNRTSVRRKRYSLDAVLDYNTSHYLILSTFYPKKLYTA